MVIQCTEQTIYVYKGITQDLLRVQVKEKEIQVENRDRRKNNARECSEWPMFCYRTNGVQRPRCKMKMNDLYVCSDLSRCTKEKGSKRKRKVKDAKRKDAKDKRWNQKEKNDENYKR